MLTDHLLIGYIRVNTIRYICQPSSNTWHWQDRHMTITNKDTLSKSYATPWASWVSNPITQGPIQTPIKGRVIWRNKVVLFWSYSPCITRTITDLSVAVSAGPPPEIMITLRSIEDVWSELRSSKRRLNT